ncbi:MAG: ABC transporter ATP-binding protein/permease [Flavobacteriaceae bacterium]|nr:ABC transporter ATP-binding protein/permease [Flavobacteriaceae bacterium]
MSKTPSNNSKKVTGKAFDAKLFFRLIQFVKNYKLQFLVASASTILLALVAAVRPWLLQQIVDNYITHKNAAELLKYIIYMFVALFTEVLLQFLFIYFANWLGQHIIKDLRIKVYKHLLSFKMQYFTTSPVGKLVTRVVSDIETIASVFGQGLFMIISDLLKMLVIIFLMLYMNWRLALIVLTVLPIIIYATKVFQIKIKGAFQEVRNQISNLNSFVQERVTGMKIVQLFTREDIEFNKFREINEKHKKAHVRTVWYFSIFFPVAEILTSIALGFVVWYGGLQATNNSAISIGKIMSFIVMSQMLFRPLRQIADKFNTLQMGMVAADRVFTVLDEEEKEPDLGTCQKPSLKGTISFKNVVFSYLKGEPVLKGISFDVKQGETVAIVGATGAGKSTIINLLNRFYKIDSGEILIDDLDISKYKLSTLRNNIAVVLQDVFLFADTIYNNIILTNKEISLAEVEAAAEKIGVKKFIETLPQGFNYNVKERGAMLSSGQRQLIAFLRAYVTKPSILILDEATSSIDSHSEKRIQKATDKITQNRTSIIIAHRLATVKKADRIIVLDKGQIVEQGTHKELLAKQGFYSRLYEIQFVKATG